MANSSSRPKPNRTKPAKSTPGPVTVTVTLLILAVSVFSVATWDRYAFAEIDLFPLWYVALAMISAGSLLPLAIKVLVIRLVGA